MRPTQDEGTITNFFMENGGGLIASGKFLIDDRPAGSAGVTGLQRLSRLRPAARSGLDAQERHRRPGRIRPLLSPRDLELLHQHGAQRSLQSVRERGRERVGPDRVSRRPRRRRAALYPGRRGARSLQRGVPGLRGARGQPMEIHDRARAPGRHLPERGLRGKPWEPLDEPVGRESQHRAKPARDSSRQAEPGFRRHQHGRVDRHVGLSFPAGAAAAPRRQRPFSWMAAYTLAKALGNTDGGNFGSAYRTNQVQDIFDLDAAPFQSRASTSGIGCRSACSTICPGSTRTRDSPITSWEAGTSMRSSPRRPEAAMASPTVETQRIRGWVPGRT